MPALDSAPRVKSSKVENQTMINLKALSNAAFATVAVLSLGLATHAASAQTQSILVTRGSHGAVSIVDKIPVGATVLPTTPSQGHPALVTRGSGGAAYIANTSEETKPLVQSHAFPKPIARGSHGAVQLID
jgi:hypothetical protein